MTRRNLWVKHQPTINEQDTNRYIKKWPMTTRMTKSTELSLKVINASNSSPRIVNLQQPLKCERRYKINENGCFLCLDLTPRIHLIGTFEKLYLLLTA